MIGISYSFELFTTNVFDERNTSSPGSWHAAACDQGAHHPRDGRDVRHLRVGAKF